MIGKNLLIPSLVALLFICCPDADCQRFPTCRDGCLLLGQGFQGPKGDKGARGPQGPSGSGGEGSFCGVVSVTNLVFTETEIEGDPTIKTYKITEPGRYLVCEALRFQGSVGNQIAIEIKSDNVVLDFNQYSLTPKSGYIVEKGVVIQPGYSNIVISGNETTYVAGRGAIADFSQRNLEIGSTSGQTSLIRVCRVSLYGSAIGMKMKQCQRCSVETCCVYSNAVGISCEDSVMIDIFSSCILDNTSGDDIYAHSVNCMKIKNSEFIYSKNSDGESIFFDDVKLGMIDGNMFIRCSASGTVCGIKLTNSPNMLISNNQFSHYDIAVKVDPAETPVTASLFDNKFFYNTATDNSLYDTSKNEKLIHRTSSIL